MARSALPCRGTGNRPDTVDDLGGDRDLARARQVAACASLTGMDIVGELPYCWDNNIPDVGI